MLRNQCLRTLLLGSAAALLMAGCSDDPDDVIVVVPPEPPPIDYELENADRCEFLDTRECMLPWPSSFYTVADPDTETGLRVNLAPASLPANKQGVQVDPTEWNRNDGFSPSQSLLAMIPGLDPANTALPPITDVERSLSNDSAVVVINAGTGELHLVFAELDAQAEDQARRGLFVRPVQQFERGERYVAVLRDLRDSNNEPLEAPEVFAFYRDEVITTNEDIEARRASMEEIFAVVEDAGIDRDSLYLAWDFSIASVSDITSRALHIRDEAFAELAAAAPPFTVNNVIDFAPCDEGDCAEGQDAEIAREISGTYTVPSFLDNEVGGPGSLFYYAEPDDGLPDRLNGNNTYEAMYICRIPRSVAPEADAPPLTPARAAVYGHGLLGSLTEVREAHVDTMANEHGFMFCATTFIGFSTQDILYAASMLQDFSLAPAFMDRQQQGFLNFLYLARLLAHDEGFASHPAFKTGGAAVFDTGHVYYDSNSMGANGGVAVMALSQDITRGVLGVPGMNYGFYLRRSTNFAAFNPFFDGSATGESGGGYPDELDQAFLLTMLQMLFDRAEASGYARHVQREPLPNTPVHAVLLQVAYGDQQVSMWAGEQSARAIGAPLRQPALETGRHPDDNPYVDLAPLPAGEFSDSVMTYWDDGPPGAGATNGGTPAPPVTNVAPPPPEGERGPHFLPRFEPAAQEMKSLFLLPEGEGAFVDTCEPDRPCFSDGYNP